MQPPSCFIVTVSIGGIPVFSLRAWYVHLLGRKAAFAITAGVEVLSCDAPSPFPSEMTKSDVSER